jgi:hypothetical protein
VLERFDQLEHRLFSLAEADLIEAFGCQNGFGREGGVDSAGDHRNTTVSAQSPYPQTIISASKVTFSASPPWELPGAW